MTPANLGRTLLQADAVETIPNRRTSLLRALEELRPDHHVCSIYESPEEHFAVAVPFIQIGLDRGEKCIYVTDDGTEAVVRDALRAGGIDVERALAGGSLEFATQDATYLKHGSFDPHWMLTFFTDATEQAMRQGYSGLRATGETGWLRQGAAGIRGWGEYESRLTDVVRHLNCWVLCQYHLQAFPPDLILDVIRTHPVIIYRGVVCRNMYYVPPDELLGDSGAAREIERLLTNIREREEVEHALRRQRDELRESMLERKRAEGEARRREHLLRLLLDALPVGVAFVDPAGDIVLNNPAAQRIWGATLHSGRARYAESKGWWHDTGARIAPSEWASARALTTGETSTDEVIDIEAFDGLRKTILNSSVPIRDEEGRIAGAVILNEDVTVQKSAEHRLNESYAQMRSLTGRLMKAQDDERRHIAQMLHETTAQDLAALKMHLARLSRTHDQLNETDRDALTECISLAEQSMREIRTLSYLLYPPFLDESGLPSALRWYAAGFTARSGIRVDLDLPEHYDRPPRDIETALFRVVQEALINIYNHSASETASIRLARVDDALLLEIADRGSGIAQDALTRILNGEGVVGVGIAGMSERVEQLGGRLEITSKDHGTTGTIVRVWLPLAKIA